MNNGLLAEEAQTVAELADSIDFDEDIFGEEEEEVNYKECVDCSRRIYGSDNDHSCKHCNRPICTSFYLDEKYRVQKGCSSMVVCNDCYIDKDCCFTCGESLIDLAQFDVGGECITYCETCVKDHIDTFCNNTKMVLMTRDEVDKMIKNGRWYYDKEPAQKKQEQEKETEVS